MEKRIEKLNKSTGIVLIGTCWTGTSPCLAACSLARLGSLAGFRTFGFLGLGAPNARRGLSLSIPEIQNIIQVKFATLFIHSSLTQRPNSIRVALSYYCHSMK